MPNLEKVTPEGVQLPEHLFSMEEISGMEGDEKIMATVARIDDGISKLKMDRKMDKLEVKTLIEDLETAKELYLKKLSGKRAKDTGQPEETIH
jgi:hypothetical protein